MLLTESTGPRTRRSRFPVFQLLIAALSLAGSLLRAEPGPDRSAAGLAIYRQLRQFTLSGSVAQVEGLQLRRDRATIIFDQGLIFLEQPIADSVRGAVFQGRGRFRAEVPPNPLEPDYVRRMLDADVVESDFRAAVLRFTDDTISVIGRNIHDQAAPPDAVKPARDFESRFLKETGANISARLTVSLLNREEPGVFVGQFTGGRLGRFTLLLDYQGRIPTMTFGINSGEKGLIVGSQGYPRGTEVWMAFHTADEYEKGQDVYSDFYDLVDIIHAEMEVDVRRPKKRLAVETRIDMRVSGNNLQVIPFSLSNSLPEVDSVRRKKGMKLKAARYANGDPLEAVQEEWEGGLSVFLPVPRTRGESLSIVFQLEGDFLYHTDRFSYPLISDEWYPRHGFPDRATYSISFRHHRRDVVAGVGVAVQRSAPGQGRDDRVTVWTTESPVEMVTFALGPFVRYEETARQGDQAVLIEFYSPIDSGAPVKEDFIAAEMMNSLNYFTAMFGRYPHKRLGGVYHDRSYGQAIATLLMLPPADKASKYTYAFIAHETAHQWWGHMVGWRSYRDQWLSEAFAEYSEILYTILRASPQAGHELIEEMRYSLRQPIWSEEGIGRGKLAEVGPLVLGRRLDTSRAQNAYEALLYAKGALVLRMLHFLFTDPSTGKGDGFTQMLADFVEKHRNRSATTEDFIAVANEHFATTQIARKSGLRNLDWFFRQWVYQAVMPSYRMDYKIEDQAGGAAVVRGVVYQENVPDDWRTLMPVVFQSKNRASGLGVLCALGRQTSFQITLPQRPDKVELDPDRWILSESTRTRRMK